MRSSQQRMMRKARGERRDQLVIEAAFDRFMDEAVAALVSLGLTDVDALEVIFSCAEHCATEGLLPVFPEEREQYREVGEWLVRAHDFGFVEFVAEALAQEAVDAV